MQAELSPTLIAAAYCWGAVIPITTLFSVLLMGLMRTISEDSFVIAANLLNGCADVAATDRFINELENATREMGLFGAFLGILTISLFLIKFTFEA